MDKFMALLKVVRFSNLLIILLIQILIKFYLINAYLNNITLSNINFSIYIFTLITIVAGGYIINDIYDIEVDTINKPNKTIIEQRLSKGTAIQIYYIINFIAISSGFYIAFQLEKIWLGFIFIFFAYSLYQYSKNYKTKFLIGNLQVAFLTALSILILALFDLPSTEITSTNGSSIIFYIILIYAGFSFITTLIREIIKDLEDIEGDRKIGANTLPISCGIAKTKKIIRSLILIPIIGIGYFQYFQYSVLSSEFSIDLVYWGVNSTSVIYTFLLQSLLVILLIKTGNSSKKADFHSLSLICKIIMLIGILSIPLFYFLY